MANRWWIGWTLALVASTCAGAAFAQSDADMAARRLLLEQAQQARTGGDHTRALDLASRAGRISMTASVRRFIAEEENSLGRYASALGSAELCVHDAEREPASRNRDAVASGCRTLASQLRGRVGHIVVRVPTP